MKLKKIVNEITKKSIDFEIELEQYIFKIAPDILFKTFSFKEGQSVRVEDCIYKGKVENFNNKKFKLKICKKALLDFKLKRMRLSDFLNREDCEDFITRSLQSYFYCNYGSLITEEDENIKFCIKGIKGCTGKTLYQVSKIEIKEETLNFPWIVYN